MSSIDFLKPFLKSTKTTLTVDGVLKKAQKSWDKHGVDAGGGSWRTDFTYNSRVLLATGGDTITARSTSSSRRSSATGRGPTHRALTSGPG